MLRDGRLLLGETIVAAATPPGEGAIAIVRLSGPDARAIATATAGEAMRESHRMVRATLRDAQGNAIDDALVVEMHAPKTYTGEDVVEFHLHGARLVVRDVVDACVAAGARLAEPGEYTLRAFLNGRLDLSQAESVADLIHAQDRGQRDAALTMLDGGFGREVGALLTELEGILAGWRAALDFPDYPTEVGLDGAHLERVRAMRSALGALVERCEVAAVAGHRVVLAGAPNAGKSSLLNAWCGEERVLVDATAGTTRDPVSVDVQASGQRLQLWDTAGLRDGGDALEARGRAMTQTRLKDADLVLWLLAGDDPVWPDDTVSAGAQLWVVGSKADLTGASQQGDLALAANQRGLRFAGWVSAKTGTGVAELVARVGEVGQAERAADALVVKQRHMDALLAADAALAELMDAAGAVTPDALVVHLEDAVAALGGLLGRDVDGEVLDAIFSQFCIGK